MGAALELRLSQIVGEGKNLAVSFEVDKSSGIEVPLVEILLKDDRLVEIPVQLVNPGGKPRYERKTDDGETIRVYTEGQLVQVVDTHGKILSEQHYKPQR